MMAARERERERKGGRLPREWDRGDRGDRGGGKVGTLLKPLESEDIDYELVLMIEMWVCTSMLLILLE